MLLSLCCRWRWRRTLRWPFRRLGSWSRSGPRSRLLCPWRWTLCRRWSRRRLFTWSCRGAIRWALIRCRSIRWLFVRTRDWAIRRTIIRLCAWRTIIGGWRPRVRLRLRVVRLRYRTIGWTIRRLCRIWPRIRLICIRCRHRTIRRSVVWLHRVRLGCSSTFSWSISRLFVIRSSLPVRRIVLRLPRLRLTRPIANVALSALGRCPVHWLSGLWSFSHRYRRLLRRWSNPHYRGLRLCGRRRLDLSNLRNGKRLATIALYRLLAFLKGRWRRRRRRLGYHRTLLNSWRRLMFRGPC